MCGWVSLGYALLLDLRCCAGNLFGLRALLSLSDLEFYVVSFLQTAVALRFYCAVVNKNIRSIITTNETETFCIVEPLYFAFHTRHLASLRAIWEERLYVRTTSTTLDLTQTIKLSDVPANQRAARRPDANIRKRLGEHGKGVVLIVAISMCVVNRVNTLKH
jgi:hypothetical protein